MTKNQKYVTHQECLRSQTEMKGSIETIKHALIGEDMRSGLVRDVTEMKFTLKKLNHGSTRSRKERTAIWTALIAASALIVVEAAKLLVSL